MDSDPFNSSEILIKETLEGIPQGRVISPLLANIALDGMEKFLKDQVTKSYGARACKSLTVVRYADDIAIVHPKLETIEFCKNHLTIFLAKLNLRLNNKKTRILHTLEYNSAVQIRGFEFLGFHIRQLPVGIYKRKKQNRPYRTLIVPSRRSVSKHIDNLKLTLKKTVKSEAMISQLNPKIIGWANYFRSGVSSEIFNYLDHKLLHMILSRLKQIHRTRGMGWIYKKYFKIINKYKWTFYGRSNADSKALTLARHAKVEILRHIKVKKDFSIYDNNLAYWSLRLRKIPNISNSVLRLLKKQKGKCALCLYEFRHEDSMEIDHIIPIFKGGKRTANNIQLVHKHCHHKKTSSDKLC
jgi:RNA-directed DNA polymerase